MTVRMKLTKRSVALLSGCLLCLPRAEAASEYINQGQTVDKLTLNGYETDVYNYGTINELDGVVSGFYTWDYAPVYVGDTGAINKLSAVFENNGVQPLDGYGKFIQGGVLENNGYIGVISGNFNNNNIGLSNSGTILGGSVAVTGRVDTLSSNFNGNSAEVNSGDIYGGAAYVGSTGNVGEISGNFANNTAKSNDGFVQGGAIYNGGVIEHISGTFSRNEATSEGNNIQVNGGALSNSGEVGERPSLPQSLPAYVRAEGETAAIEADFVSNKVKATGADSFAKGGAVYNSAKIQGINSNFIGNKALSANGYAFGGALANDGEIDKISGDFSGNSAAADKVVHGGALFNSQSLGAVNAVFSGNQASANGEANEVNGGAFYNEGTVEGIHGTFSNNKAVSTGDNSEVNGGALSNWGSVGNFPREEAEIYSAAVRAGDETALHADFAFNSAEASGAGSYAWGGAVLNVGDINNVDGVYQNNTVKSTGAESSAAGGAFANYGKAGNVNGVFDRNSAVVKGDKSFAYSGALLNWTGSSIDSVNATFTNNTVKASGTESYALGGALGNWAVMNNVTADFLNNSAAAEGTNSLAAGGAVYSENGISFVNSNFYNNSVTTADGAQGHGGAIAGTGVVVVSADGQNSEFKGNTVNGESNAIYMAGGELRLEAYNGGKVVLYDDVDGSEELGYDMNISGDAVSTADEGKATKAALSSSSEIYMADNKVDNVYNMNLNEGGVLHLGKDTAMNVYNYNGNGGVLKLDMEVNEENEYVKNGIINVANDVTGHTDVLVNSLNEEAYNGAQSKFLIARYDDEQTESDFRIAGVEGSPYAWIAARNLNAEDTEGSTWYLALNEKVPYQPEITAYTGMQRALLEQNRSIADGVSSGLAFEKLQKCNGCSCSRYRRPVKPEKSLWGHIGYRNANIKAPSDMDATVEDLTAGLDLYRDYAHRAGVFAVAGKGEYDFSGKGEYFSRYKSDLDIKSYTGGLYYKYDRNRLAFLATLFAGKSDLDVKAKQSYVEASTDAMQYGASAELARSFAISRYLSLEPSLGLRYMALDIDSFADNRGKTIDFDLMHYLEAELGLKFEYNFCNGRCSNKLYVKPSVLKTFAKGAKTRITKMAEAKTYDDEVLGRVEAGGSFGISKSLSGYAAAGYTFGEDYDAYDVNVGLNYAF